MRSDWFGGAHCCGSVLRIRDVYSGSRIRSLSIPDPGSELFKSRIPDPHQRIKAFNPKNCFYVLGNMMFIPDLDPDFLPIPDLGVKKAPDAGSGSATLLFSTNFTSLTLTRKIQHCKLAKLWLKVFLKNRICKHVLNQDPHEDRHHFDANSDSDLDRHQHGNSDPDQNRLVTLLSL